VFISRLRPSFALTPARADPELVGRRAAVAERPRDEANAGKQRRQGKREHHEQRTDPVLPAERQDDEDHEQQQPGQREQAAAEARPAHAERREEDQRSADGGLDREAMGEDAEGRPRRARHEPEEQRETPRARAPTHGERDPYEERSDDEQPQLVRGGLSELEPRAREEQEEEPVGGHERDMARAVVLEPLALVLIARGDDLAKRRPKHGERDQDHERLDAPAGGERDRSGDP